MLFKLSNLNSNLALTLAYLNPALNNAARDACLISTSTKGLLFSGRGRKYLQCGTSDEIRSVTYLKAYLTCKGNTPVNIF